MSFTSLVHMLELRAEQQGPRVAFRFLEEGTVDGPASELTYAELRHRADAVSRLLHDANARPGDRVLLLYPPGLAFIEAFFGCLRGGFIAVPAYPPDPTRPERGLLRLAAIVTRAKAHHALVPSSFAPLAKEAARHVDGLRGVRWVPTDADLLAAAGGAPVASKVDRDTIAFLQFTSGSTGAPKGVVLSHGNVIENQIWTQHNCGTGPDCRIVSWLPQYHDLGLIGAILHPMHIGTERTTLFAPHDFLRDPIRWLRAVSHERATDSAGPSFAYDLAARRATDEDIARLDLSRWVRAYNGAEPIRADAIDRFAERFRPCGFKRDAIVGCYGMAESTLTVTHAARGVVERNVDVAALEQGRAEVSQGEGRRLVSSGSASRALADIRIVDPDSCSERPERRVGEVWISGSAVAQGYWDDEENTRETFGARLGERSYLRTGDLGFIWDGELFITGRRKDLLIVRGRNLYPQDLEFTTETAHPAVRRGCIAAFPLDDGREERIGLVAEIEPARTSDSLGAVAAAIRTVIAREHDVRVDVVVLIAPRALPKTSSGKIARRRARARYAPRDAEGVLLHDELTVGPTAPSSSPDEERSLIGVIAAASSLPEGAIDLDAPAAALGLDSLATLALVEALSRHLGRPLDAARLWRESTLRAALEGATASSLVVEPGSGRGTDAVSFIELGALALMARSPSQTPYNLFFPLELTGPLDAARLGAALDRLTSRRVALRTGFAVRDARFVRMVVPEARFPFTEIDLSGAPNPEAELAARCHELRQRSFDLARPPLAHATLLRLGPERFVLALLVNHVIVDAFSTALLLDELAEIYRALGEGRAPALPTIHVDADDVAVALVRQHGPALARGKAAFPRFDGDDFVPPFDRPRPAQPSLIGARVPFAFDASPAFAATASLGLPPAVAVLAAYAVAVSRWAGKSAIAFNLLQANRRFVGASQVVAFLIYGETIAARFAEGDSWRTILARAAAWALEERFETQPRNMLAQPPSLRFLLNYYNRLLPASLADLPLTFRPDLDPIVYLWDIHDLMVRVAPTPHGLVGEIIFRSEVLDRTTVERLISEFERALAECEHLDALIVRDENATLASQLRPPENSVAWRCVPAEE